MSSLVIDLRRLLEDYPNLLEADQKARATTLLTTLSDSTVQSSFGGTIYDTSKSNAMVRFDEAVQDEIAALFDQFESVNGDPAAMKMALDEIFKVATRERDSGAIDIVDFNYVKNSLCDIIVYYELPSKTCGTEEDPDAVTEQEQPSGGKSVLSKVIRVVLIVVGVLAVAFVILIVLFAIKARKQKQLTAEEETPEAPVKPVPMTPVTVVKSPSTPVVSEQEANLPESAPTTPTEPNAYAEEPESTPPTGDTSKA